MSAFVDTGVWYAYHDRDATRHDHAVSAFRRLVSGRYGRLYTSDYVYDEAVVLTRQRTGNFADAKRIGDRIRGVGEFPMPPSCCSSPKGRSRPPSRRSSAIAITR